MNLGTLHSILNNVTGDLPVLYDDGKIPGEILSWRGRYNELTLDWNDPHGLDLEPPTVGSLRVVTERLIEGATLQGYKGGTYTYHADSPVWADEYGTCPGYGILRAVVGAEALVLERIFIGEYIG